MLRFDDAPAGSARNCNVLIDFDPNAFEAAWLHAVEAASPMH